VLKRNEGRRLSFLRLATDGVKIQSCDLTTILLSFFYSGASSFPSSTQKATARVRALGPGVTLSLTAGASEIKSQYRPESPTATVRRVSLWRTISWRNPKLMRVESSLADKDKDGALDIHELRTFVNALSHPDTDVKQISLTHDTRAASPKNAGAFRTQVSAAAGGLHHSN
jgi:hypothetical protein